MIKPPPTEVQNYINTLAPEVREALLALRGLIAHAAPEAEEKMSYGIAAFAFKGKPFVYYAGFKKHVSIYPKPQTPEWLARTSAYKGGKGTVQFPVTENLPAKLIADIVTFRLAEAVAKVKKA